MTLGPDKQWVLFQRADSAQEDAHGRLMRALIPGGAEQEILSGKHFNVECASLAPVHCVLAEVRTASGEMIFYDLDPQHGKGRELARVYRQQADGVRWSLSPEGSRTALFEYSKQYFDVLSVADQKTRRMSVSTFTNLRSVTWSAANDGFFVCGAVPKGSGLGLHRS